MGRLISCALTQILLISLLRSSVSNAEGDDYSAPVYDIQPDYAFTRGRLYYRALQLDVESGSLYVGGMNHLFRLWVYNINDTDQRTYFAQKELPPADIDQGECRRYGSRDPDYHCQNHVRTIFRLRGEPTLYVCSTNAFKPAVVKLDPTSFASVEGPTTIIGICSGDPELNTTAVYVESGNPGDIPSVYSGIRTGSLHENHLIYRPPLVENGGEAYPSLHTTYTDSKWLNEPQFVNSFDIGDHVYFFFRESAVEYENCGRATYSRVARVCKKDLGGKNVLRQTWATYLKARLNCSLPGEFPFYFDNIQSVYKLAHGGDTVFYATFTTGRSGFVGSAICSFSLRDIDNVFDRGAFKEQTSPSAAWLPTSPEQVPTPRPGSCVEDTRELSDSALHFVKNHVLMNDAVNAVADRPLFAKRDLVLSSVVVDVESPPHGAYHVIFSGTNDGLLYKIASWTETSAGGAQRSKVLSIYRLPESQRITAMQLLPNEFIYVAQDNQISQLNVAQCGNYISCSSCTSDPYCSWNNPRQLCFKREDSHVGAAGWVLARPDRPEQAALLCDSRPKQTTRLLYPGDSLYLQCGSTSESNIRSKATDLLLNVKWKRSNGTLQLNSERVLSTVDGGLVVVNATLGDAGIYECLVHGQVIIQYNVQVDDVNCQKPRTLQQFQTVYKEWCREFQNYKLTMTKWQKWYEVNAHCATKAPTFKVSGQRKTNRLAANHVGQ